MAALVNPNDASFAMPFTQTYPIGKPGTPWGAAEIEAWRDRQRPRRSYAEEVLAVIEPLCVSFEVVNYGHLPIDPERYPLVALRSRRWNDSLPIILITGGVHGYETSGVHGTLEFLQQQASAYAGRVNLLVAPCVSPWGYEMIQRWNSDARDPNRSFFIDSPVPESAALMQLVRPIRERVSAHIDLHETTDSDESEFRPALAARDGEAHVPGEIPDGFYLVDDSERPQPGFQNAIINAVAQVTHIADADADGNIIGSPRIAPGVIRYPLERLGLCAGMTNAVYKTTTEVYPDSPRTSARLCNDAQVAAVCAAIEFVLDGLP